MVWQASTKLSNLESRRAGATWSGESLLEIAPTSKSILKLEIDPSSKSLLKPKIDPSSKSILKSKIDPSSKSLLELQIVLMYLKALSIFVGGWSRLVSIGKS